MQGVEGKSSMEQEFQSLEQMKCQTVSRTRTHRPETDNTLEESQDMFKHKLTSVGHSHAALKENIRELLNTHESVQSTLDDLRSQTVGPQATKLMSKIASVQENKTELTKEIDSLTSVITHKESQETHLERKVNASTKKTLTDFPGFMTGLGTLSKVSNVKWDYNTPEDIVKGFALRPNKKDVVPFKFNKKSHSNYFITNFLWEQIGADNNFL